MPEMSSRTTVEIIPCPGCCITWTGNSVNVEITAGLDLGCRAESVPERRWEWSYAFSALTRFR
jgi:hypothetical protein